MRNLTEETVIQVALFEHQRVLSVRPFNGQKRSKHIRFVKIVP